MVQSSSCATADDNFDTETNSTVPISTCIPESACDCLEEWQHEGLTHSGCATTPDAPSRPWCKVSALCHNSTYALESATQEPYAYRHCPGDTVPGTPCVCNSTCSSEGWCTAGDPLPCADAPTPRPSGNFAYLKCVPSTSAPETASPPSSPAPDTMPPPVDHCVCMDSWTYAKVEYSGCQTINTSPGMPWCIISSGCDKSVAETGFDPVTNNPFTFRYCADGADPHVPCSCSNCTDAVTGGYCEVGNAPCRSAPEANAGKSAFAACVAPACECLSQWEFNGTSYASCGAAAGEDVEQGMWCAVNESCLSSQEIVDPSNNQTIHKAVCIAFDACECLEHWEHGGVNYSGCAETGEWPGERWCQVHHSCLDATLGWDASLTRYKFIVCPNETQAPPTDSPSAAPQTPGPPTGPPDGCQCLQRWAVSGVTYTGCQTTIDRPGNPWCMVPDSCEGPGILNTTDEQSGYFYKYRSCDDGLKPAVPCECASACTESSDRSHYYCTVANPPCATAPAPTVPNYAYAKCLPPACHCLHSWSFNGTEYAGCGASPSHHPNFSTPWCAVSEACTLSQEYVDPTTSSILHTITCEVSPCDCEAYWEHKSGVYGGCATTPDSPSSPWCKVSSDCETAIAHVDGYRYVACTGDEDPAVACECGGDCVIDAGVEYCTAAHVPCAEAPTPVPAQNNAFVKCSACKCKPTWVWDQAEYYGCQRLDGGNSWCFIESPCTFQEPTLKNESAWAYCVDPDCECPSSWTADGEEYEGCAHTGDGSLISCPVGEACPKKHQHDGSNISWAVCGRSLNPPPTGAAEGGSDSGMPVYGWILILIAVSTSLICVYSVYHRHSTRQESRRHNINCIPVANVVGLDDSLIFDPGNDFAEMENLSYEGEPYGKSIDCAVPESTVSWQKVFATSLKKRLA
ncbi:hypothetical protein DIPPA_22093 [Diplonema papillatum]|nr:hypothetical protein DIPPA_22093 [Diplonema papillatum]